MLILLVFTPETMSKLRIITSKELTEEGGSLYLVSKTKPNGEIDNYIAYNSENNIETRISYSSTDKYRPIYASEVIEKLRMCNWFIHKKLFVSPDGNIKISTLETKEKTPLYEINTYEADNSSISLTVDDISEYEFNNMWVNIFTNLENLTQEEKDSLKSQIEYMATSKEIYLFNSSKSEFDFLNESNSIAVLVGYNSDTYTNSVDIKSVLSGKICENNVSSLKVDLSIQYTKGGSIVNHDTTFQGFKIENEKLVMSNFIENVMEDITIEYLNGIIRVFPASSNVGECIISNCSVIYGNFK